MRAKEKRPRLATMADGERIEGARIGRVVSFDGKEVKVQHDRAPGLSLAARVSATLDDGLLADAARDRAEALLLFENGDFRRPVLVALLRSATPFVDALLAGPLPPRETVARVDGRRVLIEGQDEVVLQCGRASLTLQRDGKVVLRGVNLVTQADQVHKIRGGKVQIN